MPFSRNSLAAVLTGALLALPGSALAQSAGDEQYADPFQGTTEADQPPARLDRQASGTDDAESPTPTTQVQATTPAQTQTQAQSGNESLAYTGAHSRPLVGLGVALLVLGFALRRLARPAYRMFY